MDWGTGMSRSSLNVESVIVVCCDQPRSRRVACLRPLDEHDAGVGRGRHGEAARLSRQRERSRIRLGERAARTTQAAVSEVSMGACTGQRRANSAFRARVDFGPSCAGGRGQARTSSQTIVQCIARPETAHQGVCLVSKYAWPSAACIQRASSRHARCFASTNAVPALPRHHRGPSTVLSVSIWRR